MRSSVRRFLTVRVVSFKRGLCLLISACLSAQRIPLKPDSMYVFSFKVKICASCVHSQSGYTEWLCWRGMMHVWHSRAHWEEFGLNSNSGARVHLPKNGVWGCGVLCKLHKNFKIRTYMKLVCLSVVLFLSLISLIFSCFPDVPGLEGQQMVRLCIHWYPFLCVEV